eukprot:COSAG02_NODE_2085_length_9885_cov_9.743946_10_plen_42_part_00
MQPDLTRPTMLQITIGGRKEKRKVMSACKSCMKHVPKRHVA